MGAACCATSSRSSCARPRQRAQTLCTARNARAARAQRSTPKDRRGLLGERAHRGGGARIGRAGVRGPTHVST
jgi:hypothetical protein